VAAAGGAAATSTCNIAPLHADGKLDPWTKKQNQEGDGIDSEKG